MNRAATFIIAMLLRRSRRGSRIHGEDTIPAIASVLTGRHHLGRNLLSGSPGKPRRRIAKAITSRTISKLRSSRCSLRLTAF